MNKSILMVALMFPLISCTNGQSTPQQNSLSANEFLAAIQKTEGAVVIDVRTPEEYEKGHVENAVNINWKDDDFDRQIATLDKSTPVFVYCLSGGRSGSAVKKMRKDGFEHVYEMPGGMMEWRAEALPETTGTTLIKEMSLDQYQFMLQSDKLVLVDFYADWCAPCKKMKPYLDRIEKEMKEQVTLIRIDADAHPQLCRQLEVSSLPVLKIYSKGKEVWQHLGYIGEEALSAQLTAKYE